VLILFPAAWKSRASSLTEPPLARQITGGEFFYAVRAGDTLTGVGARFGVDARVIAANNKLAPTARVKTGQRLRIDNRHIVLQTLSTGIVINIPQRMLFHFKDGRLVRHFPVGLGRPDWPTPIGPFKIVMKEENPTWDVPPSIQEEMRREGKTVTTCVPPGPDNPLGKHWLGLSLSGYGIHGTIAPTSIYQFRTHGCIRAHPDDIAELFHDMERGTPGVLLYRRLLVAKSGERLFLEVHRDSYNREPDLQSDLEAIVKAFDLESMIDRRLAQDIMRRQDGIAREITRRIGPATRPDERASGVTAAK
jgi:L,D-transpeptidase ErfK/SrfK